MVKVGFSQRPNTGLTHGIGSGEMAFAGEEGVFTEEVAHSQRFQQNRPLQGRDPVFYLAMLDKIQSIVGAVLVVDGTATLVAAWL